MQKILNKSECTGCTACFNICPKSAIEMIEDKNGFKHPNIIEEKCINCGLCKKTCPILKFKENKSENKSYVGYAKDKKYTDNSSSGGIFPLIAEKILNENGIVIGAAFDNRNLVHIAIENKNELNKLKGSKYLQSDLNNIFKFIKDNVKDKKILFVGLPCQVAGLKSFLDKDYENLLCIDLICHGVPSPKLFYKYLEEIEEKYNNKVIKYDFRDKSSGWDTYSNSITLNNKKITELHQNNAYIRLFLSNIALRESCYNCNFKLGNKYSDITLGDFWGVNKYYPEFYNKRGVSAIIINTKKGKEYFENIKEQMKYKECSLEEIIEGNPMLIKSAEYSKKRNEFFYDMDSNKIGKLVNKYTKKTNNNIVKRILKKILKILKIVKTKI